MPFDPLRSSGAFQVFSSGTTRSPSTGHSSSKVRHVILRIVFVRIDLLFTHERFLNLFTAGWRMRHDQLPVREIELRRAVVRKVGQDAFTHPDAFLCHVHNDPVRRAKMERVLSSGERISATVSSFWYGSKPICVVKNILGLHLYWPDIRRHKRAYGEYLPCNGPGKVATPCTPELIAIKFCLQFGDVKVAALGILSSSLLGRPSPVQTKHMPFQSRR